MSEEEYKTPKQWRKANHQEFKKYRGQWVAYTKNGVIAHHPKFQGLMDGIEDKSIDFVVERIYETEFIEPIKFYPIRFRNVKAHEWQPKYEVVLKAINSVKMDILVDSGADFSLIPQALGLQLGFTKSIGEKISMADGIGGSVEYLLRNIELEIDSHHFTAPVAWIQNDDCQEALLGREVVFDLFDIEFKQAEEIIIFKWRGDRQINK